MNAIRLNLRPRNRLLKRDQKGSVEESSEVDLLLSGLWTKQTERSPRVFLYSSFFPSFYLGGP